MSISDSQTAPGLNIAVVCDNATSPSRASRLLDEVTQAFGEEALNVSQWTLEDLDRFDGLPQAIKAATVADVIMVSLAAAKDLPLLLCVWIAMWLPHRQRRPGALVAIVDEASPIVQQYLEAVARRSNLDFYPQNSLCLDRLSGSPVSIAS
jgi:hypothetical protein